MSNHRETWWRTIIGLGLASALAVALVFGLPNTARADSGDFSVQVSPSPLAITLKPGQSQTSTIIVRNFSNHTEDLQAALSGFHIDSDSQNIQLNDQIPANLAQWITFKHATLSLAPGASAPLEVNFNTPTDVGFNYSLAITLKRVGSSGALSGAGTHLDAGVAVFCLINIDRPDANNQLIVSSFTSDRSHYNFLPVNFSMTIKNGGNVIGQPTGSIFIQRAFNSRTPIATIPLNPTNGYVLPGTSRTFTSKWQEGFPVYITTSSNGKLHVHLHWDWKHVNQFRFGRYVAKAVMVYDGGRQDVPVISSLTFWVIPWWLLLLGLVITAVLVTGLIGWGRLLFKGTRKVRGYARRSHKA